MKRRTNPGKAKTNSSNSSPRTELDSLDLLIEKRVENQLDQRLQQIFGGGVTVEQTMVRQTSYSGPLPPSDETARYEQIHPGFVDRWTRMAERAQEAEIKTVKRRDNGELAFKLAALLCAFVVCLALVCGGVWLLHGGKSIEGFGTLAVAVGAVIWGGLSKGKAKPVSSKGNK